MVSDKQGGMGWMTGSDVVVDGGEPRCVPCVADDRVHLAMIGPSDARHDRMPGEPTLVDEHDQGDGSYLRDMRYCARHSTTLHVS
mgnify:CR=1 FL=1|jgi:hypothetical protein